MIIIAGSRISGSEIGVNVGKPEYSYYFLYKAFKAAIERVGTLIEVSSIDQVDRLYLHHSSEGQQVLFLCFSPPYQVPLQLHCPTVCVFAWEFETIPTMTWIDDPRHSWQFVFERIAGVIATSSYAAQQVERMVDDGTRVTAMPSSTWDSYQQLFPEGGWSPILDGRHIPFEGCLVDSLAIQFNADGLALKPAENTQSKDGVRQPEGNKGELQQDPESLGFAFDPAERINLKEFLKRSIHLWADYWAKITRVKGEVPAEIKKQQEAADESRFHNLYIEGVVFTTVLNPADGRKNWVDIITAFCWAFKHVPDATLVVKMTHYDMDFYRLSLMTLLSRLAPFQCRVIVLHAFLTDAHYHELIKASTFYVNASTCEGLCLPLMEFLSSGKPAIAPDHTAMHDYVSSENSIVLKYAREPTCWPHDPAGMLMTYRYRLNWQSLAEAYRSAYDMAKRNPDGYQSLSRRAYSDMRSYCSVDSVGVQLKTFLKSLVKVEEGSPL